MTEENPKPECIFCGIVEGKIGSAKIYEDEFVLAVLDIMPASNGQAIVIPKKHVFVNLRSLREAPGVVVYTCYFFVISG